MQTSTKKQEKFLGMYLTIPIHSELDRPSAVPLCDVKVRLNYRFNVSGTPHLCVPRNARALRHEGWPGDGADPLGRTHAGRERHATRRRFDDVPV